MTQPMTEALQQMVRSLGEALYNDPREHTVPMATADAAEAIQAQLTENTGTHFLDSGMASNRHWQKNQENPPWEDPEWDVQSSFVTHNVYHFMESRLQRNETCVVLEMGLWAYTKYVMDSGLPQLSEMEAFAEDLLDGSLEPETVRSWGLPTEAQEEIIARAGSFDSGRGANRGPFTHNTYNTEVGSLSQVLQGTNLGGPHAEYAMIQVHQGCDVRGGYSVPRVYRPVDTWTPMEVEYRCTQCDFNEMGYSGVDHDELLYQRTVDPWEYAQAVGVIDSEDEEIPEDEMRAMTAREGDPIGHAHEQDGVDGAVFHVGEYPGEDRPCGGLVHFSG